MKTSDVLNITIAAGQSKGTLRSQTLDLGEYDRIAVINRNSAAPTAPVELEIRDNSGTEIVPSQHVDFLKQRAGGSQRESMEPVVVDSNQTIHLTLTASEALAAGASYQVKFLKTEESCVRR